MALKPLTDHIIVKPKKAEEVTASGIIIPDSADKERPEQGEVISIGPGRVLENGSRSPMEVEVGQTVLFKKYSPDEVKLEGEKYLVIKFEDILAVIE